MNTNDTIARHLQGDAVVTDVGSIRDAVERCGADNVLCVVTTTSCFAPRLPDKVAYKKPDTMLFVAYVVVAWWPGSLVAWWLGDLVAWWLGGLVAIFRAFVLYSAILLRSSQRQCIKSLFSISGIGRG